MKKLLFLFMIVFCFPVMGQVHKSVTIFSDLPGSVSLSANFLGNDSIYISLNGRDSKYTHTGKIVTIFYGTSNEFYSWCNQLQKFSQENEPDSKTDFNIDINGQRINLVKWIGKKALEIFEKNNPSAVCVVPSVYLLKIQKKFTDWADNNNIEYK